jgi:hypothetical protein
MRVPKEGEVYEHFKGDTYKILLVGLSADDQSVQIVYKSTSGIDTVWIRSLDDFMETITMGGHKRFTLIS